MADEKPAPKKEIKPEKKSPKLAQIEKLIEKNSDAVAKLLRNWLNNE